MHTSVILVSVTNHIDSITCNFVWGGSLVKSKVHLLAWDRICKTKDHGGLGLRKARELSQAYMMKLGWAILNNPDKLWVRIITSKYLKETDSGPQLRRKAGERRRRHLVTDADCQRCKGFIEDTLHVVRDCHAAREKAGSSDSIMINTDGSVLHPHSQAATGASSVTGKVARGYKKVHLQLNSLADVKAILGDQEEDSRHG
ncbi:Putative ribonuclease H protein At1g65750 [Linum perenne]